MYHAIEFRLRGLAELETPGRAHLEQLVIKQGTRLECPNQALCRGDEAGAGRGGRFVVGRRQRCPCGAHGHVQFPR